MRVSTPEVTVLDLVASPGHGGGLSNVATVVGDLLEDDLDLRCPPWGVQLLRGFPALVDIDPAGSVVDED